MGWPKVHTEFETLKKLQQGYSIARFGDGEFKMMDGAGYTREPPNKKLAHELRQVLRNPHPMCLRGIPTFDKRSPKYSTWIKHAERFRRLLRAKGEFYSAFISRPDSAPWIRNREFALEFEKLWARDKVLVLCEINGSALRAVTQLAAAAVQVECPTHQAYQLIDEFEAIIVREKPGIAILSCGMTATCLANRLAARGIQAIDFGSGGSFIAKELAGA